MEVKGLVSRRGGSARTWTFVSIPTPPLCLILILLMIALRAASIWLPVGYIAHLSNHHMITSNQFSSLIPRSIPGCW